VEIVINDLMGFELRPLRLQSQTFTIEMTPHEQSILNDCLLHCQEIGMAQLT